MSSPFQSPSARSGGEPERTPSGERAPDPHSGDSRTSELPASDESQYSTQQYPAQTPPAPQYQTSQDQSSQEQGRQYPAQSDSQYRPGQYDAGNYGHADASSTTAGPATDFESVRTREKDAFGGLKLGSAFFGWLTSVGASVVLLAIVAAVVRNIDFGQAVRGEVSEDDRIVAVIVVVVVLFLAYYCGGYVAGRMARFNGLRQGLAVWLWSILVAVAVTALIALTEEDSEIAQDLDLPVARLNSTDVNQESLIALGIVLGVTLVGALAGGLAGMRFHRRVDRAGFEADRDADPA